MTGPSPAPPGYDSTEQRNWAVLTHALAAVGIFFGGLLGWVAPLVTLLSKGDTSPKLRAHAVSALNFNLTWAIIDLIAVIIAGCAGFVHLWPLPWLLRLIPVVPFVFNIIALVKANNGECYRHPLSYPLVK
ncbi:DUF4870 domain-containing protein [Actinocatenispora comari]|jgi:uncharacterized Tic20 family protein|uniref:Orotate phosphoribosyltransferase n=1 Tax=Actinocatenispora comari TaxID=2807577 RepID=A0A8J4EPC2_9ACTN|nr:DUF4870 domain-containing protein [Actinocatenispora comari]GIL28599.1 orotate phosphoribosyltransferase [Actinocatenispora comari]